MKAFLPYNSTKRLRSVNKPNFTSLRFQRSEDKTNMAEAAQLRAQIDALTQPFQQQTLQVNALQQELSTVKENQTAFHNITTITLHEEISFAITNANEIDLELFKALPKFDGDKNAYRSWRSQVLKVMDDIKSFTGPPRYYSAVGIIRTKVIGTAADILSNHNTKLNFYSIINRLDYTFADQRNLVCVIRRDEKNLTRKKEFIRIR